MMNLPSPDEPDLVVSDLAEFPTRQRFTREMRPLLNALSVVIFVAVLIASIFWLRGLGGSPQILATSARGGQFPVLKATPPSLPPPGEGWNDAGLGDAVTFAIAPNDARRLYTCAFVSIAATSGTNEQIIFGVSHDGGVTWNYLKLPQENSGCDISVDPTDASDIMLGCSDCTGASQPIAFMRSYDSGVHWQPLTLPPRPNGEGHAPSHYYNVTVAWAGSTLFLAPTPDNDTATWLAAAPAHRDITWVDQRGLFSGLGRGVVITQLFAAQKTLFVQLGSQSALYCPPCTFLMRSDDDGASWHAVTASHLGNDPVDIVGGVDDGSALLGHMGPGPGFERLLRSFDGGATWQALPAFPTATLYELSVYQTPDRCIYAALYFTDNRIGIYSVAPGASTWRLVAPLPDNGNVTSVSFDIHGHPVAIWGIRSDAGGHSIVQRHAP